MSPNTELNWCSTLIVGEVAVDKETRYEEGHSFTVAWLDSPSRALPIPRDMGQGNSGPGGSEGSFRVFTGPELTALP